MLEYALVPALAAITAAGAVYLGNNLDEKKLTEALPLPDSAKKLVTGLQETADSPFILSTKNVDVTLRTEKGIQSLQEDPKYELQPTEGSTGATGSQESLQEGLTGVTGATGATGPTGPTDLQEGPEKVLEKEPVVPEKVIEKEPVVPTGSTSPEETTEVSEKSPTVPEETTEVPEKVGGAVIGRPQWGEISSNVRMLGPTGGTGSGSGFFSSFTKFVDPTEIQLNLRRVRELIIKKKAEITSFDESVEEKKAKHEKLLDDFSSAHAQRIISERVEENTRNKLNIFKDLENDNELKDLKSQLNNLITATKKKNSASNLQPNQGQQGNVRGGDGTADAIKSLQQAISARRKELEKIIDDPVKLQEYSNKYKLAYLQKERVEELYKTLEIKKKKMQKNTVNRLKLEKN